MKKIMIIAALLAGLVSCKEQEDDYVDLKDYVMFVDVRYNVVPNYEYKYKMLGSAQKRIINGENEFYRSPSTVFTNKRFELNTYFKSPLDKTDSLASYP